VINRLESAHYSSHFFAATLVSFWLTLCQSHAQSRETAFGQVRRSVLVGSVENFASGPGPGGEPRLYCWSRKSSLLVSAGFDSLGIPTNWTTQQLLSPVDEFTTEYLPSERKTVAAGIDRSSQQIFFYSNTTNDTLKPSTQITLPINPNRVVFGDLNNDRRPDFLVVDRSRPGAVPFFGLGNGNFKQGKLIAEDNAIADLTFAHLNNDGLVDIVCHDWVKSEIHLLYGIGQGKFLDQASFPVSGEVQSVHATNLRPGGELDIIVSYTLPARIEIFQGDGLGGFKSDHTVLLREPFTSLIVHDVNGDQYKDLVGIDGGSVVHTYINGGEALFEDRMDFVGGRGSMRIALTPGRQPGFPGVVTLDRLSSELVMMLNGADPAQLHDSVSFATPSRPRGVTIADVDRDGASDVALVSSGSSLLAVYLNDRQGALYGPTGYVLSSGAQDIKFHSSKDSLSRFLISYPDSRQVSVMALDVRGGTATNATISTGHASEFLYWQRDQAQGVSFFTFSTPGVSGGGLLAFFQELETHQFLERSFRLPAANPLLAADVGPLNGDEFPDVAFISRNSSAGRTELAVSWGDSTYSFRQKAIVFDLAEKSATLQHVWLGSARTFSSPQIFLYCLGATPVLERFRQAKGNTFERPDTIAVGLKIQERAHLRFADVDGDARTDIVVWDAASGSIGWLKATADSFEPFHALWRTPSRVFFDLGDLNGDRVLDLAVVLPDRGVLKIYDGATLLRGGSGATR
jgi:hypothetical protein